MRRALEFEISRIGARSIHLRDNIFRSKYEYYIISAVDGGERREGGFLPLPRSPPGPRYLPLPLSPRLLLFSSRVFISLLLQSAPLALPSSSYFFFLFIFHAAKANACIMRGTGHLAVLSESNDLRESGRVIDRQQKRARELQRYRCLTLSFL